MGLITGREDPLDEGMTTHSNILAWRIPQERNLVGNGPECHRVRHKWSNLAHTHTCAELPEIDSEWRNTLSSNCFQVGILCCCLWSLTWEVGEFSRLHLQLCNRGWAAGSYMHTSHHSKLSIHSRSAFLQKGKREPWCNSIWRTMKTFETIEIRMNELSLDLYLKKKKKKYGKKCEHWKVHWFCVSSSLVKYVQCFWILYKEYDLFEKKGLS